MAKNPNNQPNLSEEARYILSILELRFRQLETIITNSDKAEFPVVIKPTQVCKTMGWSRSKFEQFKRAGLFRTFKIGGIVYVYPLDLIALFPKDYF